MIFFKQVLPLTKGAAEDFHVVENRIRDPSVEL